MEMERLRQTHAKEVESRDEEVEEIRQSCQKKVGLSCGPSAQEGLGCLPMPWPGAGSCQPGTVTQHPAPTQPTTAQLHRPGGSDQSCCCPGQHTPGFVPLVAQTPSWWGHPVSPGCEDT